MYIATKLSAVRAGLQSRLLDCFGLQLRFLKNLSWQTISMVITISAGFGLTLLLGRFLGPEAFGLYAMSIGVSAVCLQAFDLRLSDLIVRFLPGLRFGTDSSTLGALIGLGLALSAGSLALTMGAMFACAYFLSDYGGNNGILTDCLIYSALTTCLSNIANAVALGILRSSERFKAIAIASMFNGSVKLGACIILLSFVDLTPVLVILVCGGIGVVINVYLITAAYHALREDFGSHWRQCRKAPNLMSDRPAMLRFCFKSYLFSLSSIPMKELDVILFGLVSTPADIGVYRIAKNFCSGLWALVDSAMIVCYPDIVKRRPAGTAALKIYIIKFTKFMALVGIVVVGMALSTTPYVIGRFLGDLYSGAHVYLCVLALGVLISAPLVWVNPLLLAYDRPDLPALSAVLGGVVCILSMALLIPLYGSLGAAISIVVAGCFSVGASMFFAVKVLRSHPR